MFTHPFVEVSLLRVLSDDCILKMHLTFSNKTARIVCVNIPFNIFGYILL